MQQLLLVFSERTKVQVTNPTWYHAATHSVNHNILWAENEGKCCIRYMGLLTNNNKK